MKWNIGKRLDDNLIAHLLKRRNINSPDEFLNPQHPSGLTLKDVGINKKDFGKAINRIKKAIDKKEKIVVFGDYDVDGITATAILWETLNELGADVLPYLPDRKKDGYGFSESGIKNIMKRYAPSLIVSVDHGITAGGEVEKLAKKGIDVVVTDHHQVPSEEKLANLKKYSKGIVHTTSLSGAGIAWYLSSNLIHKADDEHLALAAFGTVADIVPLLGSNRQIASYGLKILTDTKRVGLKALKKEAGILNTQIEPYHIGYILGPRINAAGRIKQPIDALRLLCTKDEVAAATLAKNLSAINRERQRLLEQQLNFSLENLKEAKNIPHLLILADEGYDEGIAGLIAGKLVDRFNRPTIVISQNAGGISKASARSIPGVNIIKLIGEVEDLLLEVGGHPMAAGFTIETESIPQVAEELIRIAQDKIESEYLERFLDIDAEVELDKINRPLYEELAKFAPFGQGNPKPIFCANNIYLSDIRSVGLSGKHLKFKAQDINAIAFNRGYLMDKLNPQETVSLAFNLDLNRWNGREILQLKVRDVKL